jgi:hypothetical protein
VAAGTYGTLSQSARDGGASNRRCDVDRIAARVWYDRKARVNRHFRSASMADKSNDPVAMWQNMLGEMEKGFNTFAGQAMASPEFSKIMNQVGSVGAGAQKQLGELMEKYLTSMNLPSRAMMIGLGERLHSIEGQLNEIKAMLHQVHNGSGAVTPPPPKPPRTKRPPSASGEQK